MGLSEIHHRIIDLLRRYPDGLTAGEIRRELNLNPIEQTQLGRRRRELYPYFEIEKIRDGRVCRYVLRGPRTAPAATTGAVSLADRAQVLQQAAGRCGMCGRTTTGHGIALVVDHRVPREWGGSNDISNLWAICEDCNAGKKNLFATMDAAQMKAVLAHSSVHVRLGEFLKIHLQKAVEPWLLHFVSGGQDDWKKRVRELRYLGWEITVRRRTTEHGRVIAAYELVSWTPWPVDPTDWIRRYEIERAERNR